MSEYADFLDRKAQLGQSSGFDPVWMPEFLFPFQRSLTEWAIRKGRAALFADCGLGKTAMQLVWAENVVRKTNGKVLVLTPLAVSDQTEKEAAKFGIEAKRSRGGDVSARIVVTNYEQLSKYNSDDFDGVVLDESSCIKAMDGVLRDSVTNFMRKTKYRLLCTATAAPNDYVELGTSSEALGDMGQRDMITMFFKQETASDYLGWARSKYRLKGHAEHTFWRWVCSWSRACRKPSDIGFSDDGFILPPLEEVEHVVSAKTRAPGWLFDMPAMDMQAERAERRRTIKERCERAAELATGTDPVVVWCHLNAESDTLAKMIPGSVAVSGSDSLDNREESFRGFADGSIRVIVIKPKIGAWGLNWQHCNRVVTFASHSYEQYYQSVRRCWRFGQTKPVTVDIITSEGEQRVAANLAAKSRAAENMFESLVANMNESLKIGRTAHTHASKEIPSWLSRTTSSPTSTPLTMATAAR